MLRLFLAVEILAELQQQLYLMKTEGAGKIKGMRWVSPENMHITLKFLGSCEDDLPEQMLPVLKGTLADFGSFDFRLDQLGGFPSLRRARVFWIGVSDGFDNMVNLASLVEEALVPLGFAKEKRSFHPHVTLARLRTPQDIQELCMHRQPEEISKTLVKANSISLFKSTLTPGGAVYERLAEVPFSQNWQQ